MITRAGPGWQIVLADLALILFVAAFTALGTSEEAEDTVSVPAVKPATSAIPLQRDEQFSPAQALYRHSEGGPGLTRWLAAQDRDPRATLTIHARQAPGDAASTWRIARGWADEASDLGFRVRVVMSSGGQTDIYASLGFDSPVEGDARAPQD